MPYRLSRIAHNLILGGQTESLCSHAYGLRHESRFWAAWVRVFGPNHCRSSWLYYHVLVDTHADSGADSGA